jgi:hypothetical protein
LSHRLAAGQDAANSQNFVHHPQAQRKAELKPDNVADDLGRNALAGVAGTNNLTVPASLRLARSADVDRGQGGATESSLYCQ